MLLNKMRMIKKNNIHEMKRNDMDKNGKKRKDKTLLKVLFDI